MSKSYPCNTCGNETDGKIYCEDCQLIVNDKLDLMNEAKGLMECMDGGTATRDDINRYKLTIHKITLADRALNARERMHFPLVTR